MEPGPRTTRQQTILRMTTAESNAWMTTGFSRRIGHGDGEPRLPHGIWRNLLLFRTARPDTEPRNPIKPLSAGAQRPHSTGIHPAQSLVLIEGLQTQNA
jgi:hypothetical protein